MDFFTIMKAIVPVYLATITNRRGKIMKIESTASSEVTITGNIKTIDDYTSIKDCIQTLLGKGLVELTLQIPDSFSMPSSVIGYLLKLKQKENIRLKTLIGDQRLYTLLDDLNLVSEFGAALKKA